MPGDCGCLSSPRPCWYVSVSITSAIVYYLTQSLGQRISLLLLLFSRSVMSDSATPWTAAHQLPCPSPSSGTCSNSCPLSRWCHPTIYLILCRSLLLLPSVFPNIRIFSNFASDGQSIGASASAPVLPVNIQRCIPLGLTGLISLQSKGLSRVFSNTTVQKHQFFSAQLSL